jgi:hypothetical protein
MLQSLVSSIRSVGIDYDILTFSDEPIDGSISCEMDKSIEMDFKQYWKFKYLSKISRLNYDIFVFIDSDHYFVRKPSKDFSEILGNDPWHSFLESPINSEATRRGDWWGVPNQQMVNLYRDFGVNQRTVYNTNGGFWICKNSFANHASSVASLFNEFQKSKGLNLPEEVLVAILSHMFSFDYTNRLHGRYMDIWASEWTGVLADKVPSGEAWKFQEYMTHVSSSVNPAIVHAMRSKSALVNKGKNIFAETERNFMPWEEIL